MNMATGASSQLPQLPQLNSTESRALSLLGQGFSPEMVASSVGVSPARISQLLSQDSFAEAVAEARYRNLASQTERDGKYDSLEDQILERLRSSLSMIFDPMKLGKLLQIVNGAKRRGAAAPEHLTQQSATVNLTIPVAILQQFVTNPANQVISAGGQDLITIQSGNMNKLLAETTGNPNVQNTIPAAPAAALSSN